MADDNDLAIAGRLPLDPMEGAVPLQAPSPVAPAGEDWPALIPLQDRVFVPPFPVEVLPTWLRDQVLGVAEETQTPPDLAGLLGLAALALANSGIATVQVQGSHWEPLNLYVVGAAPLGTRKSAVFAAMFDPFRAVEGELQAAWRERTRDHGARRRVLDARLRNALRGEDLCTEAVQEEVRRIESELSALDGEVLPRLIISDTTAEALVVQLDAQGGVLGLCSEEGEVFGLMAGRYTNRQPNFDPYLKAWKGEPILVDRVSRPPVSVSAPLLTLALTVQPSVLEKIGRTPDFEGRVLLARLLFTVPPSLVERRRPDAAPLAACVARAYSDTLRTLLSRRLERHNNPELQPGRIVLSSPALASLHVWRGALEPRLGPGGDLEAMASWAAKLEGQLLRIAGNLHFAEHPADPEPWSKPLSEELLQAAFTLAPYLEAHARAALGIVGADPHVGRARRVLDWLAVHERDLVSASEIFQGVRGAIRRMQDLEPALKLLVAHGYLVIMPPTPRPSGPGRPPGPAYRVSPRWKMGS